jgi:hypothetical protein
LGRFDDQSVEQSVEFVDGDRDQAARVGGAGRGRGGEERVSGDDQGGPAVPGFPSAVLVLVETETGFGGLERFLDAPPPSGDRDQVMQRNLHQLLGHSRQILQMDVGGMPHATFLNSIELLGAEVLPQIRKELGQP